MRGLMTGAASLSQVLQTLIAAIALTIVLESVSLWLYRRRKPADRMYAQAENS